MKKISIIVPAYNEADNLEAFLEETSKHLNIENYEFSILFIDDGSKDNTVEVIKKLREKDSRVKYISFSRNFGKEAAMQAGLEHSKDYDACIMMDADLQHPPYLIPEMIKKHEEGYKIVYTRQSTRKGERKDKTFFAKAFYRVFNKYSDCHMESSTKDYQLLDKLVVEAFLSIKDNNRFVKGIFSWVGYKRCCLEFEYVERKIGKSKFNFKKLFKYGFNGLNQFSNILIVTPVIAAVCSFLVTIASIFLFAFKVINLPIFLLLLFISLMFVATNVVLYFHMYLSYQIRRQVLNRPIYLVEDMSDDI